MKTNRGPNPNEVRSIAVHGNYFDLTPSTDTFAVVCSDGQMTSVRPVATATSCCPSDS